jgi:primosomal protein N' (replication factor Y) (superfamily II helicase)
VVSPLKLKRQKSPRKKVERFDKNQSSGLLVEVLVETPVSYLEQTYTYAVPADLVETAIVGSLVKVEYGHTITKGLILRVIEEKENKKYKNVLDVIADPGLIDENNFLHFQRVRDRFGGNLWSLLNSHIPAIPTKHKKIVEDISQDSDCNKINQEFDFFNKDDYQKLLKDLNLKCAISPANGLPKFKTLIELAKIRFSLGSVLILVSDFREFDYFKEYLIAEFKSSLVLLDTRESREARYQAFVAANQKQRVVILANRSGAFTKMPEDSTVIVVNDNDLSHYEQRSPGWNTRDVTLLRSNRTAMIFLNSYHSMEVNRLISIGWLDRLIALDNSKYNYHSMDSSNSFISVIKKGIKNGNVLVSVAEKGYANVFLCSKCRNLARCNCGGKLKIAKQNAAPSCYLCAKVVDHWRCDHCGNASPFVISKGIDRTAEEIGKAVPGFKVMISKKDQVASIDPNQNQIIISTRGCEPYLLYSAVVLLDCERIYNQATLRAEEEAKHSWFDLLARVKDGGDFYISLANNHPATQQLLRKENFNEADLRQREEAHLPPFYRTVTIKGESHELSKFASNLRSNYPFLLSGPIQIDDLKSYLIVRADTVTAPTLVQLLDDVIKVQGVKGRPLFDIRFDTYNL